MTDSRDTYTNLIKHDDYGKMMLSCYVRQCKEIEKYRRKKSTVFESTASTAGREDIHTLTLELFEMNDATAKKKAAESYKIDSFDVAL